MKVLKNERNFKQKCQCETARIMHKPLIDALFFQANVLLMQFFVYQQMHDVNLESCFQFHYLHCFDSQRLKKDRNNGNN